MVNKRIKLNSLLAYSRSAIVLWIIDNQLDRRNINELTKADLIGRRYK